MASAPLALVDRGGFPESLHRGAVAVVDPEGRLLYRAGDPDLPCFLRSAAKPLQAIPLVESGAADRLALTDAELAVVCASHAGRPEHLEAVRSILRKADLDESALRCGAHPPLDPREAASLVRQGREPLPLHNNCSGKHAGMLATCRVRGWPVDSYLEPDHPLQREIAGLVADACGAPPGAMGRAVDGCGVPTFHATVRQLARAYAVLARPSALGGARGEAACRLVDAMRAHPELVAGAGRLVTELLRKCGDRLVCKSGAEGVLGIGLLREGWGVGIKVEDGGPRALGAVALAVLGQLGVVTPEEAEELGEHARPVVRNHSGAAVGAIRAVVGLEELDEAGA